jgi:hypothetical protein
MKITTLKIILLTLAVIIIAMAFAGCLSSDTPRENLREGERYYVADVPIDIADRCTVSFILSEDKRSVRRADVVFYEMNFKVEYEGRMIGRNDSSRVTFLMGSSELDEQGSVEIVSNSVILRLNVDDDNVTGEVDFFYTNETRAKPINRFSVYVGTFPFEAEDKTEEIRRLRDSE